MDNQSNKYGGPLALNSEYKLHVSDGEGGQIYTVENLAAGWPDTILASEIDVQA